MNRAVLLLLSLACAVFRVEAQGQPALTRADFFGTAVFTSETCNSDGLFCGPPWCVKATNTACSVTGVNITDAQMQAAVLATTARTCTVSSDARCTTAALTAVFGRYPGVKAVYCNDAFLVIQSTVLPSSPSTFLDWVPTPPGGGAQGSSYSSQCVTRGYYTSQYVFKIPLAPRLLPGCSLTNNQAFLGGYSSYSTSGGFNTMPTAGPAAYTVTGSPVFPVFNNAGVVSMTRCELDYIGFHAGRNFDYHQHADSFCSTCVYGPQNYTSLSAHPPLWGYSAGGLPIFGRYLSSTAPGASVALDDCGGHNHSGVGDPYLGDSFYQYVAWLNP
jgi:hypothetical protein